jgi:hypothetical protein
MKVLLIAIAVLVLAAFALVYLNRASEKIVGAIVPIAFAALVGMG